MLTGVGCGENETRLNLRVPAHWQKGEFLKRLRAKVLTENVSNFGSIGASIGFGRRGACTFTIQQAKLNRRSENMLLELGI